MDNVYEWISETLNVDIDASKLIFWIVAAVVVVLVLLAIILPIRASKKKKAIPAHDERKEETVATKEPENAASEEEKTEEVPTEPKKTEEAEAVEETPNETKEKEATPTEKKKTTKVSSKKNKKVVEEHDDTDEKAVEPMTKRSFGKFTISQSGTDYRYRLKASNGEILVVSEIYISEKAARNGIETIKRNAESAKIEIVEDKHGLFSFRIMTKQGRCLATSANYKTKASALSASDSFKKFVVTDKIELEETDDHFEVEEYIEDVQPEEKGKLRLSPSEDGFIYQLLASNGRVIATSQVYKSANSCKDSLEKFREIVYTGKFLIFKDKNGCYQFKLYNKQKRLVLAGEVYDSKDQVVSVIESVKRFARYAEFVDATIEVGE